MARRRALRGHGLSSLEAGVRDYLRLATSDPDQWRTLLDADIVVELAYGQSAGLPARIEGREAVVAGFTGLLGQLPDLRFFDVDVRLGLNPDDAFAFYRGAATAPTGKPYRQDYVTYFRWRDGQVVHYREFFDPIRLVEALTP